MCTNFILHICHPYDCHKSDRYILLKNNNLRLNAFINVYIWSLYKYTTSILFKKSCHAYSKGTLSNPAISAEAEINILRERSLLPKQKVLNVLTRTKMIQAIHSIDESVFRYSF